MSKLTKATLFKAPTRAADKWESTNSVSRNMMEAEAAARRKKTERLRRLRMEAGLAEEAKTAKAKPRKTSGARKPVAAKAL